MDDTAIGTDLYLRMDEERRTLLRQVWSPTPWMVDAYTGACDTYRHLDIMHWCSEKFGPESWPLHGEPGNWHRGAFTVDGWTWYGFKTEAMLQEFLAAWPTPEGVKHP